VQDTISEWPVAANVVPWWLSRSVIGTVDLVAAEFALIAEYLCLSAPDVSVGSKRRSVSSGRAQARGTAVTGRHLRCISSRTASDTRWCIREKIRAVAGNPPDRQRAQLSAWQDSCVR
jgi:hypothetical protein